MACVRVAVVGAGLAGAATAAALARAGLTVDLIATSDSACAGASRLPLGVLHPHLASESDPLARVRRQGLRATHAWLAFLRRHGLANGLMTRGVLVRVGNDRGRRRRDRLDGHQAGARRVSIAEARRHAGVTLVEPAILQPSGACIAPSEFTCGLLASGGPHIRRHNARVTSLSRNPRGWRLEGDPELPQTIYPWAIIATGIHSRELVPALDPDLVATRGQATAVAASAASSAQRLPVSGNGYITPAVDGRHWVGATMTRNDDSLAPREADDAANLDRFAEIWPHHDVPRIVDRFVGMRAATPDRLPIVDELAPGLWVSVGHGSHGLGTAPLAGMLIAAAISGRHAGRPESDLRVILGARRRALRRARGRRGADTSSSWNRSGLL